jgi:hypothetical protein
MVEPIAQFPVTMVTDPLRAANQAQQALDPAYAFARGLTTTRMGVQARNPAEIASGVTEMGFAGLSAIPGGAAVKTARATAPIKSMPPPAQNVLAPARTPSKPIQNALTSPAFAGSVMGGTAGYNAAMDLNGDGQISAQERYAQGIAGAAAGAAGGRALGRMGRSGTAARMGIGAEDLPKTVQKAQAEGYEGADIGEAKKWVAARKKGLDMSQAARLQRAQAMGFDTNTPFYHGSANENIQAFKSNQSETGEGIFLTNNPFVAEEYSNVRDLMSLDELPVGATNQQGFYDLYVRGKFKPIDVKGAHFSQVNMRQAIADAKAEGFDGVDFQNINDAKYSRSMSGTTRVVFDPRNIRSVNAAFDPEETGSANILAGIGTGAAGVTAASMAGEGDRS